MMWTTAVLSILLCGAQRDERINRGVKEIYKDPQFYEKGSPLVEGIVFEIVDDTIWKVEFCISGTDADSVKHGENGDDFGLHCSDGADISVTVLRNGLSEKYFTFNASHCAGSAKDESGGLSLFAVAGSKTVETAVFCEGGFLGFEIHRTRAGDYDSSLVSCVTDVSQACNGMGGLARFDIIAQSEVSSYL